MFLIEILAVIGAIIGIGRDNSDAFVTRKAKKKAQNKAKKKEVGSYRE